jgi:hypothetical protein
MTSGYAHAACTMCGKHDYVGPLHGERGGPLACLLCSGKWHAEHAPRRRARRVVIKALKAYEAVGGRLWGKDFDEVKFAASGFFFGGNASSDDFADLTSELLTATLALTHPDKHPSERKGEAERVTQELLALKPFVFPAPEPKPPPKPSDVSSKQSASDLNDPSRPVEPAYPCDDCRDTTPSFYCDHCKAQWEKKQEEEREHEKQKRIEKNARQRKRYEWRKKLRTYRKWRPRCATCDKRFTPKRSDARYCSAACRQRAYLKRGGNQSNAQPLGREHIEQTITGIFTSNPDNAFTTNDLCDRVYAGLSKPERKHCAAVVPIAKKVCERLGEHWDWWRSETRGGKLVFCNRASVMSYAMARLKSDRFSAYRHKSGWRWRASTEEDLRAQIAPGGRDHHLVVEGGAWWKHCQDHIAKFKQATAKQNDHGDDLTSRHGGVVS